MNKRMEHLLKLSIALILALALLMPSLALAETIPTIAPDQPDYAPGDTVTLSGAGWQAGEAVTIYVTDDLEATWSRSVDVIAAEDGTITDIFELPTWFVPVYNVTATDSSDETAVTSFTDGNVSARPNPSTITVQTSWKKYSNYECKDSYTDHGNVTLSGTTYLRISNKGISPNQSFLLAVDGKYGFDVTWTYKGTQELVYYGTLRCVPGSTGNQFWEVGYTVSDPPETNITAYPAEYSNAILPSFRFEGTDELLHSFSCIAYTIDIVHPLLIQGIGAAVL